MAMHHSLTPVVVAGHNEPALVMIAITLSTLRTLATVPMHGLNYMSFGEKRLLFL